MSVETLGNRIQWLGHDAIRINAGKIIYFDPFEIEKEPEADIILITHSHYDHCSLKDVAKIQKHDTVIVTEKESAKKLSGNVKVVNPGDSISVRGVSIEVVPAYNIGKKYHPKSKNWLGFIVDIDGTRVYHAGDTDVIPEMATFKTDIAFLPVSGTYVMTSSEAVEAALTLNPSLAIPMHYGSLVGSITDAEFFQKELAGKIDVRILEKS